MKGITFEHFDAVVVGCGLTGGVVARHLAADLGKRVLMLEKREHLAGNLYDEIDAETGILVQRYGPHSFHTKDRKIYDYITRFGKWEPYFLRCMVYMEGRFTPSPFNFQTIDDFYSETEGKELKQRLVAAFPNRDRATIVELLKCEDPTVRGFAQFLYEKDYSLYTAKQWGISPEEIDISVLERVPVLFSYEERYFNDDYQIMPEGGFSRFYDDLIDHPFITTMLGVDASQLLSFQGNSVWLDGRSFDGIVVYTGPVDELLNGKYGFLPYRSLDFQYQMPETDSYQEAPIVAYPQAQGYTRITEYTKLPVQTGNGRTVIAVEYPLPYRAGEGIEPYYPVLTTESQQQYRQYREVLSRISGLFLCGRLADFKYYNMDQAVARALEVCGEIDAYYDVSAVNTGGACKGTR